MVLADTREQRAFFISAFLPNVPPVRLVFPPPLPSSHPPAVSLWTPSQLHPASQLFCSPVPVGFRHRPTCRASKTDDLEWTRLNGSPHRFPNRHFSQAVTAFLSRWRIYGMFWVTNRRVRGGYDVPRIFWDSASRLFNYKCFLHAKLQIYWYK